MKRCLLILLICLLPLNIVCADTKPATTKAGGSQSSGSTNAANFDGCSGDSCICGYWMHNADVGAVRLTFVDANGKAVPEAGGKSYDFLTAVWQDQSAYYNNFPGDRNKFALNSSANYSQTSQRIGNLPKFYNLVGAYNKYLDQISMEMGITVKKIELSTTGYTEGTVKNGYKDEVKWFLHITDENEQNFTEKVNAFTKALAEVTGAFNADDMIMELENCNADNEVFITLEPIFLWSYRNCNTGNWTNFLGTLPDASYYTGGAWASGNINTDASIVVYDELIPAFKAATIYTNGSFKVTTQQDLRSPVGFGLAVDWANNPAGYNCGSCALYPIDTMDASQITTVLGDNKNWALLVQNQMYSNPVFTSNSGKETILPPSPFTSVSQFAYASEEDNGANCCEELLPEKFDEMVKQGFWNDETVSEWQNSYDDSCYESCDIYKFADATGKKQYGLYYDRNVYVNPAVANLSIPARYKEIQVYPDTETYDHLAYYAYAYQVEGGAGCCNDLTADEIQLAVDAGYMTSAEAAEWDKAYEEMCNPSCKFYHNEEDDDWGILHNFEVYSNSDGGPAGFGSLAEFAYTQADSGGAGCCDSINISKMQGQMLAGVISQAEFEEWYYAYTELCPNPPDCCMLAPYIEPGYIEGEVNNCCEETHSEAKEYELDDLFCYDINLKVNYYDPKCQVEYYLEDKANLNDYCEMYCTERVTVDTPEPITAINGRYFTMKVNPVGNTTSVYIEGFKRCRMRVFYDKWEQDYYDTVEEERTTYNEIQRQRAIEKMYLDSKVQPTESGTIRATASCSCSYACGTYRDGSTKYCTARASGSATGTYSYVPYDFPNQEQDYYTIKINPTPRDKDANVFDSIELMHEDIKSEEHKPHSIENWSQHIAAADSVKGVAEANCVAKITKCSAGVNNSNRNKMPHESKSVEDESVPDELSRIQAGIEGLTSSYNATARTAKELEKQIDVCTDYFTEHDGFKYPEQHYDFQATQEFYYYQVYLDDMGELKEDYIYVDWKDEPGCIVTGPFIGGEDASDEEIKEPRYSEIYATGVEKMTDMAEQGSIELEKTSTGFKKYLDEKYEAKKQFTHDAKYKVVCEWEEEENQLFTLVPNGFSTTDATTTNFTVHERQYRVFLTTLEGQYETFWDVKGLGEMQADGTGKFDKFFEENGVTCAEEPAKDETLFTCKLEVNHSLVITGICNGTNGSDTNHDIDDCDPYKEMYRLFTFKIVDPANLFPTNPDYDIEADSAEYAYNWLVDEEGRAALDVIEARGQEDLTYAIDNLTYSFTLTPEDMRHIKNYNETREINGGYSDFELDCVCPEVANPNDGCIQCKSTFIANLANGRISYSGRSYDMTGWANERETLGQVRDGNNW